MGSGCHEVGSSQVPPPTDVLERQKIEGIAFEFNLLLTAHLETQREYMEGRLVRARPGGARGRVVCCLLGTPALANAYSYSWGVRRSRFALSPRGCSLRRGAASERARQASQTCVRNSLSVCGLRTAAGGGGARA